MDESAKRGIRIVSILGTVRPGNYTAHALALVNDEIRQHPDIHLDVVDPGVLQLPFPGEGADRPEPAKLRELVSQATGVIFATPEYHGSFSSVTKLVIENLGYPSVLSGKPVALLGVAAGEIGAVKSLDALASVCCHVGALVLPGPVSVARVYEVFDTQGHCQNPKIEKRIRSVATHLIDYIRGSICPRIAIENMVRGGE
jgi:chromate reductase